MNLFYFLIQIICFTVTGNKYETEIDKPVLSIKNKLLYPAVGKTIILIPRAIASVEEFFAHCNNDESKCEPTLGELVQKMNEPESVKSFSPFKRPLGNILINF